MKDARHFLLPSITDVLFVAIFLRLSWTAGKTLLVDADTGYHVRAGEFILDTLSVPKHDIFSFLSPPPPWTAHEWLSEIIMAIIHKRLGLTGIVVFFSFVIALTYTLLFKALNSYKHNIVFSALLVSLAMAASQLHWLARPHIFSLLLSLLWYWLLDLYEYENQNHLYWLPPLMLLWVNLHGGFMFGFILLGVYLVGNIGAFIFSSANRREILQEKIQALALITLLCILVSLINPYGYHILLFPFKLTSDRFLMDNIQEYLSPNFHQRMPFRYLLFLLIGLLAVSGKRLTPIELLLTLLLTHMALYSARYIPLFAIIVTPILSRQAMQWLDQPQSKWIDLFTTKLSGIASISAASRGHLWPVAALVMVTISVTNGQVHYKFDPQTNPVAAVEFLRTEHINGNMFNADQFGDYIIYAAWPYYKVFFDGRFDMYGSSRVREYLKITRLEPDWERVFRKYDIRWVICDANSALSVLFSNRHSWRLIYTDEVANIFVKDIPENQSVINKYRQVRLSTKM